MLNVWFRLLLFAALFTVFVAASEVSIVCVSTFSSVLPDEAMACGCALLRVRIVCVGVHVQARVVPSVSLCPKMQPNPPQQTL